MKPLHLIFILSTFMHPGTEHKLTPSKAIKFTRIDSAKAVSYYRANYKKAGATTITNLFGRKAGAVHTGPQNMLASVTFTRKDFQIRPSPYAKFFKDNLPDFSSILPDAKDFDGFRIHVGVEMAGGKPVVACLLTFGKVIGGKSTKSKVHPLHDGFVQDNLTLGIYKIEGIPFDFDQFPFILQPGLGPKTHLSCHPSCDGDALL